MFEGLGFEVGPGSAVAVTGANGSGKTSLLRIIGGLMNAEIGEVHLQAEGGSPSDLSGASHYLGHLLGHDEGRSALANLKFAAALLGGTADRAVLGRVGLGAHIHAPVRQMSAGERKRLALARLVSVPRPIWLLDEPSSALDQQGSDLLGTLAKEHLSVGGIIVAATHTELPFACQGELRLHPPIGAEP